MNRQPFFVYFFVAVVTAILVGLGCMGSGGSATGTTNGTNNGGGGGATVDVQMQAMSFAPQNATAHAGDTVRWTNSSALPHTVTSDTGAANLDSSASFPSGIPQNGQFSWTVPANATVGTQFFYHCEFHGAAGNGSSLGTGMAAQITVN